MGDGSLAELGTSPAWYSCFNCEVAYRPLQRLRRKDFTESRQLGACDNFTDNGHGPRSATCGRATMLLRYLVRVHRFSVTIGGRTYSVRARGPRSALRKTLSQYTEEPSARAGPLTATVQRKGGALQTLSGVLSLRMTAHGKIED